MGLTNILKSPAKLLSSAVNWAQKHQSSYFLREWQRESNKKKNWWRVAVTWTGTAGREALSLPFHISTLWW